jgi:hypothetical protein
VGEAAKTAYDLAYGQLRSQKMDLQFFRGQASFAAAVSGLIATVFSSIAGEKFITSGNQATHSFFGMNLIAWLITISFALSVGFAVKAFTGWRSCVFDLNPKTAIYHSRNELSYDELMLKLAADADGYFDQNEDVIKETRLYLSLALVFAWGQIPAWIVLILS